MNYTKSFLTENVDFIDLSDDTLNKLDIYAALLKEWNEKMNLTAITDNDGIAIKHFYDCLLFLKHYQLPENASLIDVGTGAGFPGMVLKIVRPDIKLTLLDALNKRLIFLEEVLKQTSLDAEIVHSRAEEGGKNKALREKFDCATARAVANMNVLSEYCLPYVKVGGSFVALKGKQGKEEMTAAQNAVKILGGKIENVNEEFLPGDEARSIITVKKISQTPTAYPRIYAKIQKKPL